MLDLADQDPGAGNASAGHLDEWHRRDPEARDLFIGGLFCDMLGDPPKSSRDSCGRRPVRASRFCWNSRAHCSAVPPMLAAKSSSSRGIDEHELLTKQDRPSGGPGAGKLQKRQIELVERAAAKKAPLPHEPETGDIVEPWKGADDDGLEIPNFLKRPLPARMVTP
jgi:hypothetical protein